MDTMQYTHLYRSPLGTITLAADSEGLTGLWFEGQKYFALYLDKEHEEKELPVFEEAKRWLFRRDRSGTDAAPAPARFTVPAGRVGNSAANPLREDDHLRRDRP